MAIMEPQPTRCVHGNRVDELGYSCAICDEELSRAKTQPAYVLGQQAQLDRIEEKLDRFEALLARFLPLLEKAEKRLKRAPAILGGLKGGTHAPGS